jgi:hypothetical protein
MDVSIILQICCQPLDELEDLSTSRRRSSNSVRDTGSLSGVCRCAHPGEPGQAYKVYCVSVSYWVGVDLNDDPRLRPWPVSVWATLGWVGMRKNSRCCFEKPRRNMSMPSEHESGEEEAPISARSHHPSKDGLQGCTYHITPPCGFTRIGHVHSSVLLGVKNPDRQGADEGNQDG